MPTITNTTGTKAVHIRIDGAGTVRALHVQIYRGEEQVLQTKIFGSIKRAEQWARVILK